MIAVEHIECSVNHSLAFSGQDRDVLAPIFVAQLAFQQILLMQQFYLAADAGLSLAQPLGNLSLLDVRVPL